MRQFGYAQLTLVLFNAPEAGLSGFVPKSRFLPAFLEHLKEHFLQRGKSFRVLEPFMDFSFGEPQSSSLSVDGTEIGTLRFDCSPGFKSASLIYTSPSELLETLVFDYAGYESKKLSDYVLLLNEFSAILDGEERLYKKS